MVRSIGVFRLALLGVLGLSACRPPGGEAARIDALLRELDVEGRAAQLVLVPISLPADGRGAAAIGVGIGVKPPGGYWLEGGSALAVARFAVELAEAGDPVRPLLGGDLNRGVGGLVDGATDFPPLWRLLTAANSVNLREVGLEIGREATALGLDLGMVRTPPTTGGPELVEVEPEEIADRLAALLGGVRRGGLGVGLQLFWRPDERTATDWDWSRLSAIELPLIEVARDAGAAALFPGALSVPSLGGDTLPLVTSPAALEGVLRRDHAWRELIVADLRAVAPTEGDVPPVIQALNAGADLVIVGGDPSAAVRSIVEALATGSLGSAHFESAVRRVLTFKVRQNLLPGARTPAPDTLADPARGAAWDAAREAARQSVWDVSGYRLAPSAPEPPLLLSPAGRGRTLATALAAGGRAHPVQINLTADSAAVASFLAETIVAGRTVLYLDFLAAEGPALHQMIRTLPDSVLARSRLVRIAFRDWTGPAIREDPPDLLVWGGGPASQLAAAEVLLAEARPESAPARRSVPIREIPAAALGMNPAGLAAAERAIEQALGRGTFTAAALAVGRSGGIVLFRGYGSIAPGGRPVDPATTLFDLASLSKVVGTASAAALLMESGDLELDAPVGRYVREFEGENKGEVTVRHLLAHTSGLPPGLMLYSSSRSPEQALAQVIRQPLRRPPGEVAEYSDLGMILLAEVIERAGGLPLDALLARRLFVPLEMESTMFLPPAALHPRVVPTALRSERPFPIRGVVHDGNAFRLGGVTGHAGLFSTLHDVTVFTQMMLEGGSRGPVRVLSDTTIRTFTARQPGAGERALGWDTPAARSSAGRFLSARAFGHTGFTGTSIWIDPERDIFVVLLTNRTYPEATTAAILALRIAVHEAAARAITDRPVTPRPGSR
jgi:CubicO group peptidase (beta-lactamase class C family)